MPPGDTLPETLVPRDDTKDTAFEVDAAILLRLDTIPITTTTGMAQLSSFTDALSKDHVLKVLLAHDQHTNVLLIPEQDPDLISSVIAVLLYFFLEFPRHLVSTAVRSYVQDRLHRLSFGRRCILRLIYAAQIIECFWLSESALHKPMSPDDHRVKLKRYTIRASRSIDVQFTYEMMPFPLLLD